MCLAKLAVIAAVCVVYKENLRYAKESVERNLEAGDLFTAAQFQVRAEVWGRALTRLEEALKDSVEG